MQVIEYYKQLLINPEPVRSFYQYATSTLAVFVPLAILSWILALLLYQGLASNREHFGEWVSVRLGWAWAVAALGALLLADIVILWTLSRVISWSSVSPHATIAALGGFLALLIYLGGRSELRTSQRALFRAQKAGQ